jgi:Holliday junction resolvasome RuvABC endonuclease subunit
MGLILGIDPGTWEGRHGWALLEASPGCPPRWLSAGHSPSKALLDDLAPQVPLGLRVALETAAGYVWQHYKGADLLSMNRAAGYLQGRFEALGIEVLTPASQDWRRVVCGKGAASDAQIAAAVRAGVLGVPARAKVHSLDAAGAALAVARGWRPVPPQLRLALAPKRRQVRPARKVG